MSEGSFGEGGLYVGVKKNPDGSSDFTESLRKLDPNEVRARVNNFRLEKTLADSRAVGLDEKRLKRLSQTLERQSLVTERKSLLSVTSPEFNMQPEELLNLIRRYKKDQIRVSENGPLYHYHQTSLEAFQSAAKMGGLESFNTLKRLGKARADGGSRTDVVQMTRDSYDLQGHLLRRGLVSPHAVGVRSGTVSVALVFDESIMDQSDYDALGSYPDVPRAPFDTLVSVLVNSDGEKQGVEDIVATNMLPVGVMTRQEWEDLNYSFRTSTR